MGIHSAGMARGHDNANLRLVRFFSFFKNFTLLACFLGLGGGNAVAEKQPCASALVLPMLASFVGVITLLRYDVGANTDVFSALPMHAIPAPIHRSRYRTS
jgi:hypothetical protein